MPDKLSAPRHNFDNDTLRIAAYGIDAVIPRRRGHIIRAAIGLMAVIR
jgi:hypothetical protein